MLNQIVQVNHAALACAIARLRNIEGILGGIVDKISDAESSTTDREAVYTLLGGEAAVNRMNAIIDAANAEVQILLSDVNAGKSVRSGQQSVFVIGPFESDVKPKVCVGPIELPALYSVYRKPDDGRDLGEFDYGSAWHTPCGVLYIGDINAVRPCYERSDLT